jgi:UDP-2,3-diacylglucosamine pyrophosphatase LpxH
MPAIDDRDIVIMSDVHMSAGYDARTGTFDRNEDFFFDGAFGRFLDHLVEQRRGSPRPWRLVILGDFFDFLQVTLYEEPGAGATSSEASVIRLERMVIGHHKIFAGLARFIAAGHHVDVVLGNHDIELIWPAVQTRFREHLAGLGTGKDIDLNQRVVFHPWMVYVPGVLYAEHGQQYDGINSFATIISPYLPGEDKMLIELPIGSFFVRYLFNYIEQIDPFADNVKPPTRYIGWALRNHPVLGLYSLYKYAQFFVRSLPKTSKLSEAEQRERREAYWRDVLKAASDDIGLPVEILVAIDEMASIPALANLRSQLATMIARPLAPAAAVVGGGVALHRSIRHFPSRSRWTARALVLGGFLAWRERQVFQPATDNSDYLFARSKAIHELLSSTGHQVPFYVFGHTHAAAHHRLGNEDDSPHYFNTGTWTSIVPDTYSLLASRENFTFVQIALTPGLDRLDPQLLVWNDNGGRAEPMPLFGPSVQIRAETIVRTVREKTRSVL